MATRTDQTTNMLCAKRVVRESGRERGDMRDAKGLVGVTVRRSGVDNGEFGGSHAVAQEKGGRSYDYVSDWPAAAHGWTWGSIPGVGEPEDGSSSSCGAKAGDETVRKATQRTRAWITGRRPRAGSPAGSADEHVLMVFQPSRTIDRLVGPEQEPSPKAPRIAFRSTRTTRPTSGSSSI
jgi:hypothetical protein